MGVSFLGLGALPSIGWRSGSILHAGGTAMNSEAAIGTGDTWREALTSATSQLSMLRDGPGIDLAVLFASPDYAPDYADLVAEAKRLTGASVLVGCSGQGVIGTGREVENEPALALEVFS